MEIIKLHPNVTLPTRGSDGAAGYDLYMPEDGMLQPIVNFASPATKLVGLGFAAKVPAGYVGLILPRSSAGAKQGYSLRNTAGVIDSDYEGEWMVNISQREGRELRWNAGDRLFQFILVPVGTPELVQVEKFSTSSERGACGFGSTGR